MSAPRNGVLAAGTFVVDRVVLIDRYPAENTLASIAGESRSSGGCPFSVLKDLAILGAPFPLAAVGALGARRLGACGLRSAPDRRARAGPDRWRRDVVHLCDDGPDDRPPHVLPPPRRKRAAG